MRKIPVTLLFGILLGVGFGVLTLSLVKEFWFLMILLVGAPALAVVGLFFVSRRQSRDRREILLEKIAEKEENLHLCHMGFEVAKRDPQIREVAVPILYQMTPKLEAELVALRQELAQCTPPPSYRTQASVDVF